MADKRLSIETIAKVLVSSIDEMAEHAKKVEEASKREQKVDTTVMREIALDFTKSMEQADRENRKLTEKISELNRNFLNRLFVWSVVLILFFSLSFVGLFFFYQSQIERAKIEKEQLYSTIEEQKELIFELQKKGKR